MIDLIKQLTGNELKVFMYIYYSRNEHNIAFKNAENLKEELDLAHSTVYNSLKTLKNIGLLEVKGSKGLIKVLKEPN